MLADAPEFLKDAWSMYSWGLMKKVHPIPPYCFVIGKDHLLIPNSITEENA